MCPPQEAYAAGLDCLYLPQLLGEIPGLHHTEGSRLWSDQSETGALGQDLYRIQVSATRLLFLAKSYLLAEAGSNLSNNMLEFKYVHVKDWIIIVPIVKPWPLPHPMPTSSEPISRIDECRQCRPPRLC